MRSSRSLLRSFDFLAEQNLYIHLLLLYTDLGYCCHQYRSPTTFEVGGSGATNYDFRYGWRVIIFACLIGLPYDEHPS